MEIKLPQNIISRKSSPSTVKLSSRSNSLFQIVLLIIVIVLFSWFVLMPKVAQVNTVKAQLETFKQRDASLQTDLNKLEELVAKLKMSGDQVAKLEEALPVELNTIRLNQLITKLGSDSGATLGELSILSKGDDVVAGNRELLKNPFGVERAVQKINISISATGNYEQLKSFLQKLENNARIMDVNSIEFASNQDGLLELQINVNVYYLGTENQ